MLIESEASGERRSSRRIRRRGHSPHQCAACRSHRALFKYRGEVRADRDHNLCFRCYRSELNRQRARRLAARRSAQPLTDIHRTSATPLARRSSEDVGKAVWGASRIHETEKCA